MNLYIYPLSQQKKSNTGRCWTFWQGHKDLFAFLPMAKIKVSLRQAVASNSPPDCCI